MLIALSAESGSGSPRHIVSSYKWLVAVLTAMLVIAVGLIIWSNSGTNILKEPIITSAYSSTSSGTTSCTIENDVVPPQALCGAYINPGETGSVTVTVSNPNSAGMNLAFETWSSEGQYVYFSSTPVSSTCPDGYCIINGGSSQNFQFYMIATQSHTASVQVSLDIYVVRANP